MRNKLARRPAALSAVGAFLWALTPAAASAGEPRTGVSATPPPPSNEAKSARARYDAGTLAFSQARFVEAALDFEAAAAEKANPIALYTAGLSWERANAPERAADDYARALALGGPAADPTGQATQRLATLEAVLGAVLVSGPSGWRGQLDANTELPLPATFHGAAGVHALTVRAVGRAIAPIALVLKSGMATRLDVPVPAPSGGTSPVASPMRREIGTRHAMGLVALGAAGALLLSGAVLGVEALGARDAYVAGPTQASYDHAINLQRWTDVAWITGGAVFAGGLVLLLWPSPRDATSASRHTTAAMAMGIGTANVYLTGGF